MNSDSYPGGPVSVRIQKRYMNPEEHDTAQIRDALSELRVDDSPPAYNCLSIPVVTHTAEAKAAERPKRLGLEKLTHAPLNFRVFPETPYSLDEFQVQIGKKGSLGKGAMGNVQLVRWMTHPDKPLRALKRISKFQMWKDDNPVVLFEQLWDEIEALMALHHKHIVGLDGYFEDYKYVYLIMEYAPNGDLNQLLERHRRLSELEAARHIESLIQALLCCHQHNYLHRDIKPENLLISAKGDLLLADFGCVATRHSTKKSLCGTRYYHSYEIVNEEPHDEASDAWSVGVVAFELLHGKSPFESDDEDDSSTQSDSEEDHKSGSEAESDYENDEYDVENSEKESDADETESDGSDSNETGIDSDDRDDSEPESGEIIESNNDSELNPSDSKSIGSSHQEVGESKSNSHIRFGDKGNVMSTHCDDVADRDQQQSEDDESSVYENEDSHSTASSEDSDNVEVIYNRIRNLDFRFPDFFSNEARDFISKLLQKDKERRMTLSDAANHPFITQLHRLSST